VLRWLVCFSKECFRGSSFRLLRVVVARTRRLLGAVGRFLNVSDAESELETFLLMRLRERPHVFVSMVVVGWAR